MKSAKGKKGDKGKKKSSVGLRFASNQVVDGGHRLETQQRRCRLWRRLQVRWSERARWKAESSADQGGQLDYVDLTALVDGDRVSDNGEDAVLSHPR